MRGIFLMLCVCIVGAVGCARMPPHSQERVLSAQTRTFPGVTVEEVREAIQEVFRLADEVGTTTSLNIHQTPPGLNVHRAVENISFELVEWWVFSFSRPTETSVRVAASTRLTIYNMQWTPDHGYPFDLVFLRVSYLLGHTDEWESCQENTVRLFTEGIPFYNYFCEAAPDVPPQELWVRYQYDPQEKDNDY